MELTEEQRKIGIKYNIMTLISLDIHNKRYTELQQMYEMLNLRTNDKLVNKLNEDRNIGEMFTTSIYTDVLLVIADYIDTRSELVDLFYTLYSKRYKHICNIFSEWEEQYNATGAISSIKKFKITFEEKFFLHFLFYRSKVFGEPDKVLKGFDFEQDRYLLNYEFYLTDKEVIADSMFFYSSHSEIEQMLNKTTADVTDKVLNSKFYDRYLLKRRNELAEYLKIPENKLAEYIHSEMKSHSKDGKAEVRTGFVGLIETCTKNLISSHNGGTSWYNNMTTTQNSKNIDSGLHYIPDVDEIIDDYFKSYVITRYSEEIQKKNGFTKLTLSRDCIPGNYENVYQTILCMYEMDVLYKMFSIMQKQYYMDFSWEKITNQNIKERYEEIVSNLEQTIIDKENRINSLMQKNHILSLQIIGDKSKQTAPLVAENNKLLKVIEDKESEIQKLKRQLQYQEQFITELNKPDIIETDEIFDIDLLQTKKFLFVGHISDVLPELKHKFSNSIFMESETHNLSGIEVDAIVMLIKWMSHGMFYKIKASNNLSKVKCIMCNTKNINSILQKIYNEII